MSGFRFRLQELLRMRAWHEQQSAQKVAHARMVADEARGRLDSLDAVHHAGLQEIARAHGTRGAAGEVQQLAIILQQLEAHISEANTMSQTADEEVVKRLDELTHAAQQRMVLDKLRERRHANWRFEQEHADQLAMDEIAITRFQLATNGGAKT